MASRSSIFSIFDHRCQDQRKRAPEARFSAFSTTGARISENALQKIDFQHFRPQAPGSAKMRSRGSIFTIFSHGARISENELQKLDFQHFRPQAPGSATMNSRNLIFIISATSARINENEHQKISFSAFLTTGVMISENELQNLDFQSFRRSILFFGLL